MSGGVRLLKLFKEFLMKKFFSIFTLLFVMAFAMTAFVSCKNDSDDDEASVVAVWKTSDTTATFYDDGTVSGTLSEGKFSGTYTGDATKDGTVVLTVANQTLTLTISGNTATDSDGDTWTKQ